jgi:hypothetical protein
MLITIVQRLIVVILLSLCVSGCRQTATTAAPTSPAPSTVTRREAILIAESYVNHLWQPTAANVRHGLDSTGVRIDTPDLSYQPATGRPGWWVPGQRNIGVPYQWGGFSTLASFDHGIARGLAAGDVYTLEKRRHLYDAVSAEAVGIDCSGYISRCWKLPRAYSTRELPTLCQALPDYSHLQPGDLLNKTNEHCLLFAFWENDHRHRFMAYETGCPPTWKTVSHMIDITKIQAEGYRPWRYRGIIE